MSSMESSNTDTPDNGRSIGYNQFTNESSEQTNNQRNKLETYLNSVYHDINSKVQKNCPSTQTWFADNRNKFNLSVFFIILLLIIIICLSAQILRQNSSQELIKNGKTKINDGKKFQNNTIFI